MDDARFKSDGAFEAALRIRIDRLGSSIRVDAMPSVVARRSPRRLALLAAVGAALLLAIGGGAVIGRHAQGLNEPRAGLGVTNQGGPLSCAPLARMTPPEADAYMRARGYAVRWQIEERPSGRFWQSDVPPDTGHPIAGVLIDEHRILYVVEVGPAAVVAGDPC
jgi:hypothetical protein